MAPKNTVWEKFFSRTGRENFTLVNENFLARVFEFFRTAIRWFLARICLEDLPCPKWIASLLSPKREENTCSMGRTRSPQSLKEDSMRTALWQPQKKETMGLMGKILLLCPREAQAVLGKDKRRGSQAMWWSCFGGCIKDEIFSVFGIGRMVVDRM